MSESSGNVDRAARLAVVGAASAEGGRVRDELVRRRVPGARVDLYGSAVGEATIAEYDGEARLVQQLDPEQLAHHDVVFLCEPGEAARRAAAAAHRAVVIDVVDALAGDEGVLRVHLGVRGDSIPSRAARLTVPHSLSLALIDVVRPLSHEFEFESACTVILCPASDAGEGGVDELRKQTACLLNFESVPKDVFGGQLAFNVLSPGGTSGARVATEVADLLDWPAGRLAVELLSVPVFYGHGITLHLRGRTPIGREAAAAAFRSAGLVDRSGDGSAGPIDVTGEMRAELAGLRDDGSGGVWAWIVVGEAGMRSAEHAVRVAERAVGL